MSKQNTILHVYTVFGCVVFKIIYYDELNGTNHIIIFAIVFTLY